MKQFAIIGYPLVQSFSANLFNAKFEREHIDAHYDLYPIQHIEECKGIFDLPNLAGMNVTIPYKQAVIPYLDELAEEAAAIGAVNVIKVSERNGKRWLKGYNTDVIGFRESMRLILKPYHKQALVFGTGGASKAISYGLKQLSIGVQLVSRTKKADTLTYQELTADIIRNHTILVNATPLGMFPDTNDCVPINYNALTPDHLLYDAIYNPDKTLFLQHGEHAGATIKNGLSMLNGQARAAWQIWNQYEN